MRLLLLCLAAVSLHASPNPEHYAQFNRTHHSALFGTDRQYRISLPGSYAASGRNYPVIYFLHGWSGWNPDYYDFNRIDSLVAARDSFIIVQPDGFMAPSDAGPYNVSIYCTHQQQYADYFLELTAHIDSAYRTVAERRGRGIIGHSMGGFMAYFLPWRFPHLISGTVNNTGSAEFPVGVPGNKTLVSWRYAMANHRGVHLRLNNSTTGELHYLNTEVHEGTLREKGLAYEYVMKPGGHQIDFPGEITVFLNAVDFLLAAMAHPLPQPRRWRHEDIYADFDVWGYSVRSDKDEPGFIELSDVTAGGFGTATYGWQDHVRMLPGVNSTVTTAPVYAANTAYTLFDYNVTRDSGAVLPVISDADGRITRTVNHEVHQVGIYRAGDAPEIVCIGYAVDDTGRFLKQGRQCGLAFKLLNRGAATAENVEMSISAYGDNAMLAESTVTVTAIPAGSTVWTGAVDVTAGYDPPGDGRPHQVRFDLMMRDAVDSTWEDELDVPVWFDARAFSRIEIDDGLDVSDDGVMPGSGNGDGIPDPGETVMVYEKDWRTRLYHDDPYISVQDETLYEESQPSMWPEDGITLTSLIKIPADCPAGHRIKLMGYYEIKTSDTMRRIRKWGTTELVVGQAWSGVADGKRAVPPLSALPNPVGGGTVCPVPANSRVTIRTNDGTAVRTWGDTDSFAWNGIEPGIYVVTVRAGAMVYHATVVYTGN